MTKLSVGHAAICEAPLRPLVTGHVVWLSPPLSHERAGLVLAGKFREFICLP